METKYKVIIEKNGEVDTEFETDCLLIVAQHDNSTFSMDVSVNKPILDVAINYATAVRLIERTRNQNSALSNLITIVGAAMGEDHENTD